MVLTLLAACGQSTGGNTSPPPASSSVQSPAGSPAETPKQLTQLKYGAPSTATSNTVWYAYTNGYFKEYGVDLDLTFFNSGASLQDAARASEIDVYSLGGMSSLTGATTFGSCFVAYLAPDNAAYRVYARNDSPVIQSGKGHIAKYPDVYGSADAWKQSTVLLTKGQSGHYTISAIATLLGLTMADVPNMDIEQNQIPAIFAAGEGDVMVVGNPNWAEFAADPDNYTMVASLDMLYPDYDNVATIMAVSSALLNKEDAVFGFVKALVRAQSELAADHELYVQSMYTWQQEYKVDATEEDARFDVQFYKLPTFNWLEEYMGGDPGKSIIEGVFLSIGKFMLGNDSMTQENFDKLSNNVHNMILTKYTLRAVEELRAEGH